MTFSHYDLLNEIDSLKRFAMKLRNNSQDADDLVQMTLLRALEKKHLFQDGTNLFRWTSKIMYNLFVTEYRRKTKFESQYDPDDILQSQSLEPDQEDKEELKRVNEAMHVLSDEHRTILVMVCIKGMQYAEVADILDIPIGTVRSRLSRARDQLKAKIEELSFTHALPDSEFGAKIAANHHIHDKRAA